MEPCQVSLDTGVRKLRNQASHPGRPDHNEGPPEVARLPGSDRACWEASRWPPLRLRGAYQSPLCECPGTEPPPCARSERRCREVWIDRRFLTSGCS